MKVNGKQIDVKEGTNLQALLENAGYDVLKIAVERNGEIVLRGSYQKIFLTEADVLEVVSFVGGG